MMENVYGSSYGDPESKLSYRGSDQIRSGTAYVLSLEPQLSSW